MNTNFYCEVKIPERNIVLKDPFQLEKNYQDQNGQWHFNINTNPYYTDERLLEIGLYRYNFIDNPPAEHIEYYDITFSEYVITDTTVEQTQIYTQWEIDRVKSQKNIELEEQIPDYTTAQMAINNAFVYRVREIDVWVDEQQEDLELLTDWDQVAAFDTTLPEIFVISNRVQAAFLAEQGVQLVSEHNALLDSGQLSPYDKTQLDFFVDRNVTAANDESGASLPEKPTYTFRQESAVLNEVVQKLLVYRYDTLFPGATFGYKMRLERPLSDKRPLYSFSFDKNDAYMTWHQFQETSPGIWEITDHSAEWKPDQQKLSFQLSYSSNHLVEAEWFTRLFELPANRKSRQILIKWDPV